MDGQTNSPSPRNLLPRQELAGSFDCPSRDEGLAALATACKMHVNDGQTLGVYVPVEVSELIQIGNRNSPPAETIGRRPNVFGS
jgi:hypothetical protein